MTMLDRRVFVKGVGAAAVLGKTHLLGSGSAG